MFSTPALILDAPEDILKAITKLFEVMLANYGPWGTLGIFAVFLVLGVAYFIYNEIKKERSINEALREKDRTIQRLASEARLYRTLFIKEKTGYSDEQIERLIIQNTGNFEDGPEARKALEKKKPPKK